MTKEYCFYFLNAETGEERSAAGYSLNVAANNAGIAVPYRGKLPQPWYAVECREGDEVLWSERKV